MGHLKVLLKYYKFCLFKCFFVVIVVVVIFVVVIAVVVQGGIKKDHGVKRQDKYEIRQLKDREEYSQTSSKDPQEQLL